MIRRLRSLFTTPRLDDELDEEMRFHLEMEMAKRIEAGMDERTARESVLRDFGGVSHHRDQARDARGVRPVEDLVQDLRVGLRGLLKQRTYAAVAILTLAIGIGATTALWAAVYRVLLAPLPFAEASRIVALHETDTRSPSELNGVAPATFLDWKKRSRSLDMMGASEPFGFDWIGPDGPESFETALVTEDFFRIQGLRPILGRTFVSEEFQPGHENVILMGETLWRNRFGADSTIVGRTIVMDSIPRVVVGIMPTDALQPYGEDIWAPKIFRPQELNLRRSGWWTVIGRLSPGSTLAQAQMEMRDIAGQLAQEFPATNRNAGAVVTSLRDTMVGDVRKGLLVLFGAVGFVLLIACVNVANLQLAECMRRRRELAIRTAIGAGRGRLMRQLLTEAFMLAVIGATSGLLVAALGLAGIRAFAPEHLWQVRTLHLDGVAVAFALALAAVTAIAVALLPVREVRRIHLAESLASGGRSASVGRSRRRANRVLVVAEVALALVLMVGAGLLVRSLSTLLSVDRGFQTDGVLVTTVQAWGYYPTPVQRAGFVRDAIDRLAVIPGVEKVGITSALPLQYPIGFERAPVTIEGETLPPGDERPVVRAAAIAGDYFDALRVRLERGRGFGSTDIAGAPPVAIVNRAFARRFFGDADPIGKRVSLGFMSAPMAREIVGVVADLRHDGLHVAPAPGIFVPHAQASTGAIHLVLRTSGDPMLFQRRVRSELAAMNGAMPLAEVTTMDALLSRSLRERRFQLGLLSAFSAIALLLSAIGIYGVMNRATSERTHEIGVRMAVGARAVDVRWMVLRNGGALAVIGIVTGVVMALLLTRYMAGMLFGVTPLDPITYVFAAGVLLAAAILATWLPAWRASAVDPVVALRND